MKIDILTLFPEMFPQVLNSSILGRAQGAGILCFELHNIRDYASNKHHQTDDAPFGGGNGMVMSPQPVFDCMEAVLVGKKPKPKTISLSPRGKILTQEHARSLSSEEHLVLLCGHYEGIDERILTLIDEEISIGDYVLTGGELPAMVLIDCISRFIPGVLGCADSAEEESFNNGLLEYPHYTRPANFRGMVVPEILLSGNHKKIDEWRRLQSLLITRERRPDLFERTELTKTDHRLIAQYDQKQQK